MCVCFYAVCVCALECASSAFVAHLHFFFLPSLYCARVCCFVSFIHSLSPACFPTTCLLTLEIEKPHFFTTGVRVDVSVALQSPGLWRNAAYSARLSRPTDTNRAPLPASPSLSDAHTSLRGCIIFK